MSERRNLKADSRRTSRSYYNSYQNIEDLETRLSSVLETHDKINNLLKNQVDQNESLKNSIDNLYMSNQDYHVELRNTHQQQKYSRYENSDQKSLRQTSKLYELEQYNQKLIEDLDQVTTRIYTSQSNQKRHSINQQSDNKRLDEQSRKLEINCCNLLEDTNDEADNQKTQKYKVDVQIKPKQTEQQNKNFNEEIQKFQQLIVEKDSQIEQMKNRVQNLEHEKNMQKLPNQEADTKQRYQSREEFLQKKIGILLDEISKKDELIKKNQNDQHQYENDQVKALTDQLCEKSIESENQKQQIEKLQNLYQESKLNEQKYYDKYTELLSQQLDTYQVSEALKNQIQEIEEKLIKATEENKNKEKLSNQYLKSITEQKSQIETQYQQLNQKDKIIQQKEQIIEQLKNEAINFEDEKKLLQIEIEELQSQLIEAIENLKKELQKKDNQIEDYIAQFKKKEVVLRSLENQIDQSNIRHQQDIQEQIKLKEELQCHDKLMKQKENDALEEISQKDSVIQKQSLEINGLIDKARKIQEELEQIIIQNSVFKVLKQINICQEQIKEKQKEIEKMKQIEKENTHLNEKIGIQSKKIQNLQEKEKELQDLKIKNKQLLQVEKRIQQKEQENDNLKNQIKDLNNTRKQLEKELNAKSKQIETKELNEKKLENKITSLEEKLSQQSIQLLFFIVQRDSKSAQDIQQDELVQWVGKMFSAYEQQKGINESEIVNMTDKLIKNLRLEDEAATIQQKIQSRAL